MVHPCDPGQSGSSPPGRICSFRHYSVCQGVAMGCRYGVRIGCHMLHHPWPFPFHTFKMELWREDSGNGSNRNIGSWVWIWLPGRLASPKPINPRINSVTSARWESTLRGFDFHDICTSTMPGAMQTGVYPTPFPHTWAGEKHKVTKGYQEVMSRHARSFSHDGQETSPKKRNHEGQVQRHENDTFFCPL